MFIFRLCLSFLFVVYSLHAKTKEEILRHIPEFEKTIQKIKDAYCAPGLAIAVIKDGEIAYINTFGVKKNGEKDKIDTDTIFQIASNTKVFFTFVVAQLVEEGVLSWDMPVSQYVPELILSDPVANEKLTLLDLLTHRVGLQPFSGDTFWHMNFSQLELIKALKEIPFKYAFRETYNYQNHMFSVASLLVERVTKKTIAELFNDRIFKPLNMKNASVGLEAIKPKLFGLIKPNFAYPHDVRDGKIFTKTLTPHMHLFEGGTGVNLSIKDAAIWMQFLLNDYSYKGKHFLKPETVKFLRTPKVQCDFTKDDLQFSSKRFSNSSYDVGMFESQYGDNPKNILYAHMGGFNGIRSYFGFIPSENLGFVVLSNFGSMRVSLMPEVIRNTFFDWYFCLESIDWLDDIYGKEKFYRSKYTNSRMNGRLYNPVSARNLEDYEGVYHHSIYGPVHIKSAGKNLAMHYKDIVVQLTHWNGNEFSIKPYELNPTFNDYDYSPAFFVFEKDKKQKLYIGQLFEGCGYFEKE